MAENPNIKWFEEFSARCQCGKKATGTLRGTRNESFGPHCKTCASTRIKASAKERDKGQ